MPETASDPISGAAYHVRGVESFGSLLAFELDRIALVQSLISVLLNGREVYKDVLTSGTLDKPISFGSVEPLDHAIFLQANSLSDLIEHLEHPERHLERPLSIYGKSWLTWNALRDETITPMGLPSVRTVNFRSSLMMLWQELELSAREIYLLEPQDSRRQSVKRYEGCSCWIMWVISRRRPYC